MGSVLFIYSKFAGVFYLGRGSVIRVLGLRRRWAFRVDFRGLLVWGLRSRDLRRSF